MNEHSGPRFEGDAPPIALATAPCLPDCTSGSSEWLPSSALTMALVPNVRYSTPSASGFSTQHSSKCLGCGLAENGSEIVQRAFLSLRVT